MAQTLGDLPVGALVMDPETKYYDKPIVWKIADKNNQGYPTDSITLITDKIISVKSFDAQEPNNTDSNRKSYGNNNYKVSNVRQWLNSDKDNWYQAQHEADQSPNEYNVWEKYNPYDKEPGFLSNFSALFKLNLINTKLKVALPNVDGGGIEEVTDKVFLISRTQLGLGNEVSEPEGHAYQLFTNDSSRKAYPTQEAVDNSTYSHSDFNTGKSRFWWMRTPYTSSSYSVRYVHGSGSLDWHSARYGYLGLRPLCNLKSEISVSDEKNSDGVYTLDLQIDNLQILGSGEDLGKKEAEFDLAYTPIGPRENAIIKVTEILDGQEKRQHSISNGLSTSFKIDKDAWKEVLNGKHTITIKANDGTEITEKNFTFTKDEREILLELKNPEESMEMPTRAIVKMVSSLPSGAAFKVEICNNAFDSNIVWQDVTDEVRNLKDIAFTNKSKTANNWGVNIRVSVKRNSAVGECYISSLQMKFE